MPATSRSNSYVWCMLPICSCAYTRDATQLHLPAFAVPLGQLAQPVQQQSSVQNQLLHWLSYGDVYSSTTGVYDAAASNQQQKVNSNSRAWHIPN
jgi:hypothetical protein